MANDKSISRINMEHDILKDREENRLRRGTRKFRNSERAEAEAFIAEKKLEASVTDDGEVQISEAPKALKSTRKAKTYDFTVEQLREAREGGSGRSWADVAKMLGLPNPGAARKAWAELTGTPHTEAKALQTRARKGATSSRTLATPTWDDDTDRQSVVDTLVGSTITIRTGGLYGKDTLETLNVARVYRFDDSDPARPAVEILDGRYAMVKGERTLVDGTGAKRTIFLDRIAEVR
jgi:hypothetical protein